jgi:protein-disulfide isomerase
MIASAQALQSTGLDEAEVRRIVKDVIKTDSKFVLDALNKQIQKDQEDEAANADKKLVEQAAIITEDKGYPFLGNKDGKVEVFYYFDINCSYCKKIDSELARFVKDNPDVRLVHREMPILTPASSTAAQIGGTLFTVDQVAYRKFHDTLLGHPSASNGSDIDAVLKESIGDEKAKEVIAKAYDNAAGSVGAEVAARIKTTLETANSVGITGTPFIYVKGANEFVRGASPDLYSDLTKAAVKVRASSK